MRLFLKYSVIALGAFIWMASQASMAQKNSDSDKPSKVDSNPKMPITEPCLPEPEGPIDDLKFESNLFGESLFATIDCCDYSECPHCVGKSEQDQDWFEIRNLEDCPYEFQYDHCDFCGEVVIERIYSERDWFGYPDEIKNQGDIYEDLDPFLNQ